VFPDDRFSMGRQITANLHSVPDGVQSARRCRAFRGISCPGCGLSRQSDALGTSRTIVVDPKEHPRIGTMQAAKRCRSRTTKWC
jgi:hypothetical protein